MEINQNIVLVRLKSPTLRIVTPPLGIGYLLRALKPLDNITSSFIDCQLNDINEAALVVYLQELNPLLIGFQVYSIDYVSFSRVLPLIKKALPNTTFVAGGPHVTALPEFTFAANTDLDFIVCGEGEVALPMLAKWLQNHEPESHLSNIPNLAYRENGKVIIGNKAEWIDVNAFGSPDWEKLQPQLYPAIQHGTFHKSTKVVPILTSRGCPYPCTFCAGSLMTGKQIRRRNVKEVVDEIELLQKQYGFEEFIIEDENFTFYKDHVLEFAAEIEKRRIKCYFSFPNGIRMDHLDEEIVQKLHAMGAYMVVLGIESISSGTLKRMNKKWSRKLVSDVVDLLKKYNFIVQANFILGFRDDTLPDVQESIDFALELNVDQVYFGNYIPLPGTSDFNLLIDKGELVLSDIDWNQYSSFYGQYPYHPEAITAKELDSAIKKATMKFYLRPRVIFGFLKRMTHGVFLRNMIFRLSRVLN